MTDRRNLLLTVAVVLGLLPMAAAEIERWNWRGLKRPWRRPVQVFFFKMFVKRAHPTHIHDQTALGRGSGLIPQRAK